MHCKASGIWWKLWYVFTKTSLHLCNECWIALFDSSSKFVWVLNFSRKPRFSTFRPYPENPFQNLSIFRGWALKQKCRAWLVKQSLSLEFFKLFRKILSNSKRRNSLNFPIQIQKFISKSRPNLGVVIKEKL